MQGRDSIESEWLGSVIGSGSDVRLIPGIKAPVRLACGEFGLYRRRDIREQARTPAENRNWLKQRGSRDIIGGDELRSRNVGKG